MLPQSEQLLLGADDVGDGAHEDALEDPGEVPQVLSREDRDPTQ